MLENPLESIVFSVCKLVP